MNSRIYSTVTTLIVICICAVLAKNVENTRLKRTIANGLYSNCEEVKPFFESKNITFRNDDTQRGNICHGHCCDNKTEAILRKEGQRTFAALLRHNSMSLQGLLSSTAEILQNHVSELARQSENKTLVLFSKVYRRMSVLSREPIATLYNDIRNYVEVNSTSGEFSTTPLDIKDTVIRFFTDLFPLAYHHISGNFHQDFTLDYKMCLRKEIDVIVPFGDIPKQIASSLSKSLDAMRLLLQALNIGSSVLSSTNLLLINEHGTSSNSECHDALLKMTYCPKCTGLGKDVKPCKGYCLNVLRGCVAKYLNALDLPWNGYVEGVESLVNAIKKSNKESSVNVNTEIRNLDTKISSAIMHSMEKGAEIDAKVRKYCGTPDFSKKEDPSIVGSSTPNPRTVNGKPRQLKPILFSPLPDLSVFLSSMAKTKGFYGTLVDSICQDRSFAEPRDQQCWNGERIAEYSKAVMDLSWDMQKYNPEVKPNISMQQNADPEISRLVEKLRHVHHMAISSLGTNYQDVYDMQSDGVDGSGSGNGPAYDETDEEDLKSSGSGDGINDPNIDRETESRTNKESPPTVILTGGGYRSTPTTFISVLFVVNTIIFRYI